MRVIQRIELDISYKLILPPYLYTIFFNFAERHYYIPYPDIVHRERQYPVSAYDIDTRDYAPIVPIFLSIYRWEESVKRTFIIKEEIVDIID